MFVLTLALIDAPLLSTRLGYGGEDQGVSIDVNGLIHVTGRTISPDYLVTTDATQPANAGDWNTFVSAIGTDFWGNMILRYLSYSTYLGGGGGDVGTSIIPLTGPKAYITGRTKSSEFPTTSGTFQVSNDGGYGAFVVNL
ncbi:MAG: hypothetical protein RMJ66_05845 [Bacteroidia bacterium]|nr:hypothetical protein [Bacteroidia bacterium]MDW8134572.1 hypothetical protein [Bacteroidia bacterium]